VIFQTGDSRECLRKIQIELMRAGMTDETIPDCLNPLDLFGRKAAFSWP
jgi:hypothetical protein